MRKATLHVIQTSSRAVAVMLILLACAQGSREMPVPPVSETIQGTVVGVDGRPAPGARVFLLEQMLFVRSFSAPAITDKAGRFRLSGSSEGDLVIVAPAGGALTFGAIPGRKPITIRMAKAAEIRIPFVGSNGEPLAGHEVAVVPTTDRLAINGTVADMGFPNLPTELRRWLTGTTDARGMLTLRGLPQGSHIGVAIKINDQYAPLVFRGSLEIPRDRTTRFAPIRVSLDGSIKGQVTYHLSGKPVAGAAVQLVGPGYHNFLGVARTDTDGHYQFTSLFPSTYFVMMQDSAALQVDEHSGARMYLPLARGPDGKWEEPFSYGGMAVKSGRALRGVDFALVKSVLIQCKVTDENDRPLYGARVMVGSSAGVGEGRPTEIDGTCRFRVPPGKIVVTWSQDMGSGNAVKGEQKLTVEEEQERAVEFSLAHTPVARPASARPLYALAPDITVADREGKPVRLSDFRGKVVVLDFWFPRDGPDQWMGPALSHTNAVVNKFPPGTVIALAVDTTDDRTAFDRWVAGHPELKAITFARDSSDWHRTGHGMVSTRYQVFSWPQRFVIAPDGSLLQRYEGANDEAELERAITAALTHRPH